MIKPARLSRSEQAARRAQLREAALGIGLIVVMALVAMAFMWWLLSAAMASF